MIHKVNKGIIVVFNKNDICFNKLSVFKELFSNNITICLVSNGKSKQLLETIENIEQSSDVEFSIVYLRKEKSLLSAVKAGVRSLTHKTRFEKIFYIEATFLNITNSYKTFRKVVESNFTKKSTKRVLLRNIYAIPKFE